MQGYICQNCCELRGRDFEPQVINNTGLKTCLICGDRHNQHLDIIKLDEMV